MIGVLTDCNAVKILTEEHKMNDMHILFYATLIMYLVKDEKTMSLEEQ
jgi:hypothetical protein